MTHKNLFYREEQEINKTGENITANIRYIINRQLSTIHMHDASIIV